MRKLAQSHSLHDTLADAAVRQYAISLDDLPPTEDEKACATYEAALCREFSNVKMLRANPSGPSNHQTPGTSASLPSGSGEPIVAEMEGQEKDPHEFVVDVEEREEASTTSDGLDLVRHYLIHARSRAEPSVGCHRTGHVVCHDPPRRDGPHSIP